MSEVGKWVEQLMTAGCMPKVAARVVTEVFAAAFAEGRNTAPPDAAAEKRRAWDRERKREQTKKAARVETGGNRVELTHVQQLWGDGLGLLRQLGVSEKSGRGNIGRWLKAGSDPGRVLGLIREAHQRGIGDPVPWITVGLGEQQNGKSHRRNKSLADAADDLIARAEEFGGQGPVVEADDPDPSVESRKATRR